jgi:hypothetical protein
VLRASNFGFVLCVFLAEKPLKKQIRGLTFQYEAGILSKTRCQVNPPISVADKNITIGLKRRTVLWN